MKRIMNTIILLLGAAMLFSCSPTPDSPAGGEYTLRGVVTEIADSHIDILITDTPDAAGTYRVLVSNSTAIYGKGGASIKISDIRTDDKLEITYNGQVMRSLPPQVVATKITVI